MTPFWQKVFKPFLISVNGAEHQMKMAFHHTDILRFWATSTTLHHLAPPRTTLHHFAQLEVRSRHLRKIKPPAFPTCKSQLNHKTKQHTKHVQHYLISWAYVSLLSEKKGNKRQFRGLNMCLQWHWPKMSYLSKISKRPRTSLPTCWTSGSFLYFLFWQDSNDPQEQQNQDGRPPLVTQLHISTHSALCWSLAMNMMIAAMTSSWLNKWRLWLLLHPHPHRHTHQLMAKNTEIINEKNGI